MPTLEVLNVCCSLISIFTSLFHYAQQKKTGTNVKNRMLDKHREFSSGRESKLFRLMIPLHVKLKIKFVLSCNEERERVC